jgi:serine O-acetyltransferase
LASYEKIFNTVANRLDLIEENACSQYPANMTVKIRTDAELLIEKLRILFFPRIFAPSEPVRAMSEITVEETYSILHGICLSILGKDNPEKARKLASDFIEKLPEIAELLHTDIQAAYDGDPAAFSKVEIVLAYPAFEAISIYRPAHVLYTLGLPLLPRIMTEFAHKKTGIDIHPGATIGKSFFIDHGTGVVIGETCVVGNNVKLYQGVTLGAKSFEKDENGNPVKGIKRHPNIGDNVVIYAGATILGGDTYIGNNCVIGGNVWLTHSVDEGCTVYNTVSEGKKIKK